MSELPMQVAVSGQSRRSARGIAMLLVIISLMMATILTSAYLASRDNSAAIGDNVASAAAARWVADSGVEFGVAVLETQATWRTSHINGRMVSNYPLAGGTVNIDLVDMETGLAPNSRTEYVRLTSLATVDGVNQNAVAECHVPLSTTGQVDVDLSEFAIFASQRLTMQGTATVARWPMAPLSALGMRVQVGTQATSASSISLSDDAASIDTTVFHGPGASATLVAIAKGQAPVSTGFLDQVPMPASPSSGVTAPASPSLSPNLTQSSGTSITAVNTRWKTVTLSNGATRMLRGNITAITDEDLKISNAAKLLIDGQVKLVVFGDLSIDAGSIELKPGARLTMLVRGRTSTTLDIRDGYIGDLRATAVRDNTGKAVYTDPERIQIFSMPGNTVPAQWTVRANSVIKGSVYAPDLQSAVIQDTSALYGRIATRSLTASGAAALFYDPALDSRAGYTNPDSPMWDNTQHLKGSVKTLASLDASALQAVANTLSTTVKALTDLDSVFTPVVPPPTTTEVVAPTDPTPRPVEVETKYVTFGSPLTSWE